MWFGTDNGLARYDGYKFKTYQVPADTLLLIGNQGIKTLAENRDGNLWIGTAQNGLHLFDRISETFLVYKNNPGDPGSLSNNSINSIYQDVEGYLWIGTNDGLNKYDAANEQFIAYRPEPENPGSILNQVYAIFEDRSGRFWIGTAGGLYVFDRIMEIFNVVELGKEIPERTYRKINCLIEDRDGILWIGSNWGLIRYDPEIHQVKNYLPVEMHKLFIKDSYPHTFLSNRWVRYIAESVINNEHVLWIATNWGLNRFNIGEESFELISEDPGDPQSISTSFLEAVYMDEAGQLWIGTRTSGVDFLSTQANPFHQVRMIIPGEQIYYSPACFLVDSKENLWVGAIDGGLIQYDRNFNLIANYLKWSFAPDAPHNNRIECIYEDTVNNLWVGFYDWGLTVFDRVQKEFRQIELQNEAGSTEPGMINNILQDEYGILWIGTDAGLFFKERDENILNPAHYVRNENLNKVGILRIYQDKEHKLWISTRDKGLYCLYPEDRLTLTFTRYLFNRQEDNEGFWGNYVSAICEDRSGILWLGSDKGLNNLHSKSGKCELDPRFNREHPGLIISIFTDGRDNLWIFHARDGLIRYKPDDPNDHGLKVFDVSEGLPFDNFNTLFFYSNSFYQSEDGRLFMGSGIETGNGFFWFHPDSINENTYIPRIVITNFILGNKPFLLDSSIIFKKCITLDHNQDFFSFEFAALDFLNPEKNKYAYFLQGFEDEWNFSGAGRIAQYTGVPPGNYTFRVKGSNNDGYWNEEGTYVHVTILPPLWKTWWGYFIYTLIVVGIIYSIIHYYLRRQRLLHKLELEQTEARKMKELDRLKTTFFTNISHEFRTPLTLILGPVQKLLSGIRNPSEKEALTLILKNAQRLRDLVSQLLSLSNWMQAR